MKREMICISCPIGCHLQVDATDLKDIKVSGNNCPRGIVYATNEMTCPKRMVTSSVKVKGGKINFVSVKTSDSIEKKLIFESLKELNSVEIEAPVAVGDIVLKNVLNTGIDFVATKSVARKN